MSDQKYYIIQAVIKLYTNKVLNMKCGQRQCLPKRKPSDKQSVSELIDFERELKWKQPGVPYSMNLYES